MSPLAILLALVPAFLFVLLVWAKNPAGKRPIGTLGLPLALGLLAIVIALAVSFVIPFAEDPSGSILGFFLMDFLFVATSEEGSKMFGMWIMENNKKVVLPYDALIYGSLIGFGFGGIENCLYMLNLDPMSALLRAFFSVPGHVAYGVIMGSFFAKAIADGWQGNASSRNKNLWLAFLIPWTFHGAYDFLLDCELIEVAFALDIAAFTWAFIAISARSKEKRMTMLRPQETYTAFRNMPQTPIAPNYQPYQPWRANSPAVPPWQRPPVLTLPPQFAVRGQSRQHGAPPQQGLDQAQPLAPQPYHIQQYQPQQAAPQQGYQPVQQMPAQQVPQYAQQAYQQPVYSQPQALQYTQLPYHSQQVSQQPYQPMPSPQQYAPQPYQSQQLPQQCPQPQNTRTWAPQTEQVPMPQPEYGQKPGTPVPPWANQYPYQQPPGQQMPQTPPNGQYPNSR